MQLRSENFTDMKGVFLSTIKQIYTILAFPLLVILASCNLKETKEPLIISEDFGYKKSTLDVPEKLLAYGMFEMPLATMQPKANVWTYDLNASLFSDYALKKRFIYIPQGKSMTFHCEDVFDFPDGSMIFKFFYYPEDFRNIHAKYRIIETRVLMKKENGWTALTYIWNDAQSDAELSWSGENIPVSWIDTHGEAQFVNYSVPNVIQCKNCHEKSGALVPIGPAGKHLKKSYAFTKDHVNQIDFFVENGILTNASGYTGCIALVNDENTSSAKLNDRARSYLDINCAHCHRPDGSARNSGLNLLFSESDPIKYGVYKPPVAAGRGSGGLKYDIFPGKAHESILSYRMASGEPGIMMPESGRKLIHHEGVALISEWINKMN